MFYGLFWTKNSIVRVILQFDLIWTRKKCENRFRVRSKRSKKVKFSKCIFWKQRHVSEAESPQQSNGTISFPEVGYNSEKIAFECMTSSLGTMGRQKHPFWGQKLSYRVETLHTGWGPLALHHIFRFFEILNSLVFCDHFSKKNIFFWNFWGQKSKI